MSLVRSWWESPHIQFNLWSVYFMLLWWGLVPTSPRGKLHPVPTAVLSVTMIWHIQYLRYNIILFSIPQIPVNHHRICYFPAMGGVKMDEGWGMGGGGVAYFKRKGEWKMKRGWYTSLHYKMLWKDNVDQIVLSFIIFLLHPGYRKPGNSET